MMQKQVLIPFYSFRGEGCKFFHQPHIFRQQSGGGIKSMNLGFSIIIKAD